MPYEDSFKENTKFHSAHYFLNQFQSKDYEDSIIQLDNPPVEPTGILPVVPTPVDVASSSSSKRLDVHSPQPRPQQTHHHHHSSQPQHEILTLNTDINEYMRNVNNKNKKKLNHHSHNISRKETPMSRSTSASPGLISPILTNNESNTSPELELLEYDEDEDDDDDHEGELWDQDEIFQMHGDALANPTVPGLFPQMEIGVNEEFLDRDRLPIEPLVHQRQ
ncbi:hypothetical protein Cantr_03754 [Candida viswanathii]|uniref:Uncharacterized protein n=1 Tax=Candida viswanathii TaxID=5486 RepID=A0A367XPK3_9ASCO|nr:hypothetical protein Cantr_03754 [Candida viswanathii]